MDKHWKEGSRFLACALGEGAISREKQTLFKMTGDPQNSQHGSRTEAHYSLSELRQRRHRLLHSVTRRDSCAPIFQSWTADESTLPCSKERGTNEYPRMGRLMKLISVQKDVKYRWKCLICFMFGPWKNRTIRNSQLCFLNSTQRYFSMSMRSSLKAHITWNHRGNVRLAFPGGSWRRAGTDAAPPAARTKRIPTSSSNIFCHFQDPLPGPPPIPRLLLLATVSCSYPPAQNKPLRPLTGIAHSSVVQCLEKKHSHFSPEWPLSFPFPKEAKLKNISGTIRRQ